MVVVVGWLVLIFCFVFVFGCFNVEGSRPEWCISGMIYSRDAPFWSGTLVIFHYCCLSLYVCVCFLFMVWVLFALLLFFMVIIVVAVAITLFIFWP